VDPPHRFLTDSGCVFCKIASGESPAKIVFEDDRVLAFHDIHPVAPVHILIVPRTHIPSVNQLEEVEEPLVGHLFSVAGQLAREMGIDRSGYRLILNTGPDSGQAVFHLHLHLIGGRRMRYPMG
jgi:histidine triad (HIT) family protein